MDYREEKIAELEKAYSICKKYCMDDVCRFIRQYIMFEENTANFV